MTTEEAFEHVRLEIASKQTNAELAREYVAERPTLSTALKEVKLLKARQLEEEATALQLVLRLAKQTRNR